MQMWIEFVLPCMCRSACFLWCVSCSPGFFFTTDYVGELCFHGWKSRKVLLQVLQGSQILSNKWWWLHMTDDIKSNQVIALYYFKWRCTSSNPSKNKYGVSCEWVFPQITKTGRKILVMQCYPRGAERLSPHQSRQDKSSLTHLGNRTSGAPVSPQGMTQFIIPFFLCNRDRDRWDDSKATTMSLTKTANLSTAKRSSCLTKVLQRSSLQLTLALPYNKQRYSCCELLLGTNSARLCKGDTQQLQPGDKFLTNRERSGGKHSHLPSLALGKSFSQALTAFPLRC